MSSISHRSSEGHLQNHAFCTASAVRKSLSFFCRMARMAVLSIVPTCPRPPNRSSVKCAFFAVVMTRRRAAQMSTTTVSALPDACLEAIFRKIKEGPVLLTCATVCKQWLPVVRASVKQIRVSTSQPPSLEVFRTTLPNFINLRELHLCSWASNQALVLAASCCTVLWELDVAGSDVSNEGLEAIAKGCSKLRSLDVSATPLLTAAGLHSALLGCPDLRKVTLKGCSWIDKAVFIDLAQHCSKMRTFVLGLPSSCELFDKEPEAWEPFVGMLSTWKASLKAVSLGNFPRLPDELGGLVELQALRLECKGLSTLPRTLGQLRKLRVLEIYEGYMLRAWPLEWLGQLQALESLIVQSVYMPGFPLAVLQLKGLTHLELAESQEIAELPSAISQLTALRALILKDCSLGSLPQGIGNLVVLETLDLSFCSELLSLPDSIGHLSNLSHLSLRRCRSLQALPASIANLGLLKELDIGGCVSLPGFPNSICQLPSLESLNLASWFGLARIPASFQPPKLKKLVCSYCVGLKALPKDLGKLPALEHLDLRECGENQETSAVIPWSSSPQGSALGWLRLSEACMGKAALSGSAVR